MADFFYEGQPLETKYIEGNDTDFAIFIQSLKDKAELKSIEGKFRWVIEGKYIARPASAHE